MLHLPTFHTYQHTAWHKDALVFLTARTDNTASMSTHQQLQHMKDQKAWVFKVFNIIQYLKTYLKSSFDFIFFFFKESY